MAKRSEWLCMWTSEERLGSRSPSRVAEQEQTSSRGTKASVTSRVKCERKLVVYRANATAKITQTQY